ncbi:hypothetical protein [Nocardia terpenica]|uniref:Uncharacterized protein n=1 Tax=Nocardia terpenica TaxID=455432 RepID=A0A6G9Z7H0_9NOCA|nr:hypothetical protein [Nocardia terpenica]QIS21394.1 hypothetical protein F6W96_26710 [Nocardia terpenica]
MNTTRIAALLGASTLAAATMLAAAAPANATPGMPPVHGCPGGDTCGYPTESDFTNNRPVTVCPGIYCPYQCPGPQCPYSGHPDVFPIPVNNDVAIVNNTDPLWTSEGDFVLEIPGVLCVYVPGQNDVQAPDTIENPTDRARQNAIAVGQTRADVTAITVVALSNCQ